jgi:cell wall-associated NlpC family hydrolase
MPYGSIDAQKLSKYIKRVQPNSPLTGDDFVWASNQSGVSPYALAAIARKESSLGTTNGKFKFNPMGYGVHAGPSVYNAANWRAGILRAAKSLAGNLYKGSGLTTFAQILPKYAPSSENNTPLYIQQANQYIAEAGGKPNASIFDGSDAGGGSLPATTSPNESSATPTGGATLMDSVTASVAGRQKGESLLHSVMNGVMANALGAGAVSQRQGVTANPSGASGLADDGTQGGAMAAAFRKAKGLPYTWGGGTPNGPTRGFAQGANTVGYDCSSLAQMLWSKAGVSIPRTTYGQIKIGRAINAGDRNQWRVGDLLFPSTGHVQIYAGNGQVWEAPRTGGVVQQVAPRSHYIAVRRPG